MGVAILASERSKDPNTQVGACIVSADNRILSVGYNGTPNGYEDRFSLGIEKVMNLILSICMLFMLREMLFLIIGVI